MKSEIRWNKYPEQIPYPDATYPVLVCDKKGNIGVGYLQNEDHPYMGNYWIIEVTKTSSFCPDEVCFWAVMPEGPRDV
jgi:hypothetical protein